MNPPPIRAALGGDGRTCGAAIGGASGDWRHSLSGRARLVYTSASPPPRPSPTRGREEDSSSRQGGQIWFPPPLWGRVRVGGPTAGISLKADSAGPAPGAGP